MWVSSTSFLPKKWGMDYGFKWSLWKASSSLKTSVPSQQRDKNNSSPVERAPGAAVSLLPSLMPGRRLLGRAPWQGLNSDSAWPKMRHSPQALSSNFCLACRSKICGELRWCVWDGSYILNSFLYIKYASNKATGGFRACKQPKWERISSFAAALKCQSFWIKMPTYKGIWTHSGEAVPIFFDQPPSSLGLKLFLLWRTKFEAMPK